MPSNRARISAERIGARNLILNDSAPKNKLIYQNIMVFSFHQKLHIPEYGCLCTSIDWLDLIDKSWTRIDVLRDTAVVAMCTLIIIISHWF